MTNDTVDVNENYAESYELFLHITNSGKLYKQQALSIISNYRKKIEKGTYEENIALKGWYSLAVSGAKDYIAEYGDYNTAWHKVFNVACRKRVSSMLADYYRDHLYE